MSEPRTERAARVSDRFVVWLAEGCGSGRLPKGPGTWGSVVGLAWAALLLVPRSPWFAGLGALAGVGLAVWICGRAERILGRHDPGSVVLDEIVAMPICFVVLVASVAMTDGFPGPRDFLGRYPWWIVPGVFAAFRLFDIWKPWPVRQIQALPGGWGVVADDVLAAVWVAVLTLALVRAG